MTADGPKTYYFAVIGNPCDKADMLHVPFVQPFGFYETTLAKEAAEVRCSSGLLEGATLSDHGYPILSMFFDAAIPESGTGAVGRVPQPGFMSKVGDVEFQDEHDFVNLCRERKEAGYNSGMGEIFRRVASISPIKQTTEIEITATEVFAH
jgi:hypothetical protein